MGKALKWHEISCPIKTYFQHVINKNRKGFIDLKLRCLKIWISRLLISVSKVGREVFRIPRRFVVHRGPMREAGMGRVSTRECLLHMQVHYLMVILYFQNIWLPGCVCMCAWLQHAWICDVTSDMNKVEVRWGNQIHKHTFFWLNLDDLYRIKLNTKTILHWWSGIPVPLIG